MNWNTLVDPTVLLLHLNDPGLRLVDARFTAAALVPGGDQDAGLKAWQQSHLPGASYLHLNRDLSDLSQAGQGRHPLPDEATFLAALGRAGIGPEHQVVVYDAAEGGMAAARLWWLLKLLGHARVAVLDGGLAGWRAAGLPETDEVSVPAPLPPYPGHFDRTRIVDAGQVAARLSDTPGWLIDARAFERYSGQVEPVDPVAGHVPGALNRPFQDNVAQGRLRDPQALRVELLALLGPHAPGDTVLMCGSGVTACHLLLAFEHAGLPGPKIYAGSWSGWIADPTRPVATS